MFDRIVVGTDGSETATEAVNTAVELAKLSKAKLEIVSAYEPVPQQRLKDEGEGISGDVSHAVNPREDVQFVLDKAAAVAKKAKVDVVTHPREGDPADAILDVAEENDADLVLVGNKGMTGARRFLLGSVPNKISHHAPCDVWIVEDDLGSLAARRAGPDRRGGVDQASAEEARVIGLTELRVVVAGGALELAFHGGRRAPDDAARDHHRRHA